ncbi:MAG: alpha/beta hydrolase [Clostridia bacterium]|nr:alpha/beta hydrolase [Clostridia bacterium]
MCLHGWGCSHLYWRRFLSRLDGRRMRAYALDLPGFGGADKPVTGYALDDLVEDVRAFLEAVGAEGAVLAGHSFGGTLALAFAAAHPDKLRALLLVATVPGAASPSVSTTTRRHIERLLKALRDLDWQRKERFLRSVLRQGFRVLPPPRELEAFLTTAATAAPAALTGYVATSLSADLEPLLERVRVPTLIVHGERDFVTERDAMLLLRIPESRLVTIADAGHYPMVERDEAFAAAVLPFLEEVVQGDRTVSGGVGRGV